jgi:gas vesicle protein
MARKYRLRNLKSVAAQTLEELSDLAKDKDQSPAKRAVALLTKAELVMTLVNAQSGETRARIKCNLDDEKPEAEKAKVEKPVVKAPETLEQRIARLKEGA